MSNPDNDASSLPPENDEASRSSSSSSSSAAASEEIIDENDIPHLLTLAAEHDRVDILQSLLNTHPTLLNAPPIPPLHTAISSGSLNAVNCLLRMGADPSIRPCRCDDDTHKKFAGCTAWELSRKLNLENGKKEQMEHAFFVEGIRAVNEGEVERLKALLESGMDGRELGRWALEMEEKEVGSSKGCLELLRSYDVVEEDSGEEEKKEAKQQPSISLNNVKVPFRDDLKLKLEETQSLAQQLSLSLLDVRNEVAICQSLLLGGSSALVSHVKNMKAQKAQKEVELDQYRQLCVQYEEELRELGRGVTIAERSPAKDPGGEDREEVERKLQQSEAKVRSLRASIIDLAEENARNLEEIERRGLSGAVRLARSLREELTEIDYHIKMVKEEEQKKSAELKRLRVHLGLEVEEEKVVPNENLMQARLQLMREEQKEEEEKKEEEEEESAGSELCEFSEEEDEDEEASDSSRFLPSTAIVTGKSTSLTVRQPGSSLDFWEILRRILGKIRNSNKRSSTVMVV